MKNWLRVKHKKLIKLILNSQVFWINLANIIALYKDKVVSNEKKIQQLKSTQKNIIKIKSKVKKNINLYL